MGFVLALYSQYLFKTVTNTVIHNTKISDTFSAYKHNRRTIFLSRPVINANNFLNRGSE